MKYGIVIFPSKNLQDLANSYRKRYDPHYALIPPHLTLKSAFELENEQVNEVVSELRKIAKETAPLQLKVSKISSFSPVNNVIYLKVEPNESLTSLWDKLHHGKLESNADYAFVPHITIGQKLSNDEHSDILGQLKMKEINHVETIDRFHLLYQLDNEQWTVYETFRLGSE